MTKIYLTQIRDLAQDMLLRQIPYDVEQAFRQILQLAEKALEDSENNEEE